MDITDLERRDSRKIEIFCCYARRDQPLLLDLKVHLTPLQREGLITLWADVDINAGAEWEDEIHHHLNTAHVILLLVSPDFMASDYCYSIEMRHAMERHKHGDAQVIPIIVRPTAWQNAPFGKLQALPKNAMPLISSVWHTQDDAFLNIVEGIRGAVEARLAKEEARWKAKQIEQTLRVGEQKQANLILEQEGPSRPANRASTISKIEPIRLLFCLCIMSIGVFVGIFLGNSYNWSNGISNYVSLRTSSEVAGAFIAITTLFGGFAFLIISKSARVNMVKGAVLIFIGNALLFFSIPYNSGFGTPNGIFVLPLWLVCTNFNDIACTSINYFIPGIISIVLCICIILLGGWFFCQQANATMGAIVGSLIIIMSIGLIALLSTELITFGVQERDFSLPTPPDLGIPFYLFEIMFGIATIFITRHNKARI